MTDEIGAEYRYLCEECAEILTPREVGQHVGECAAVNHLARLDMWLTETVEECPECEASVDAVRPTGARTWVEWHESGSMSVKAMPCDHTLNVEDLLNEHGE